MDDQWAYFLGSDSPELECRQDAAMDLFGQESVHCVRCPTDRSREKGELLRPASASLLLAASVEAPTRVLHQTILLQQLCGRANSPEPRETCRRRGRREGRRETGVPGQGGIQEVRCGSGKPWRYVRRSRDGTGRSRGSSRLRGDRERPCRTACPVNRSIRRERRKHRRGMLSSLRPLGGGEARDCPVSRAGRELDDREEDGCCACGNRF